MAVPGRITNSREHEGVTFPPEIRNRFFSLALPQGIMALGPNLQPPAVLLALAPFTQLYAETKGYFEGSNFVVTGATCARFQRLRNPELNKIEHLTIMFDRTFNRSLPSLHASVSFLRNSLTTITMDLTREPAACFDDDDDDRITGTTSPSPPPRWKYPTALTHNLNLIDWLMKASRPGVKTLVVRICNGYLSVERADLVLTLMAQSGPQSSKFTRSSAGNLQVFTWEALAGEKLVLLVPRPPTL